MLQYGENNEACLTLRNINLPVNATITIEINKTIGYSTTERTIEKSKIRYNFNNKSI